MLFYDVEERVETLIGELAETGELDSLPLMEPTAIEVVSGVYEVTRRDEALTFRVEEGESTRFVLKKKKKEIPLLEYGSWICSDPVARLDRDFRFTRYLDGFHGNIPMPSLGYATCLAMGDEYGIFAQVEIKGTRLDNCSPAQRYFVLGEVVKQLAIFHECVSVDVSVPKIPVVDHKEELRVICELNGWPFRKLMDVYRPFLKKIKNSSVCHNTLHWKNVFVQGDDKFAVLDWELVAWNTRVDDLVRLLEGPSGFSEKQKMDLLGIYYQATKLSEKRWDWEDKKFGVPDVAFEDLMKDSWFKELVELYHLRRAVLNWWAYHHFKECGKPDPESRMLASLDSLDRLGETGNKRNVSKLERVLLYTA